MDTTYYRDINAVIDLVVRPLVGDYAADFDLSGIARDITVATPRGLRVLETEQEDLDSILDNNTLVEKISPSSRWVSVVFLQDEEADRALHIFSEEGPDEAADFLAQWDYGDETTLAALANGYVYDVPGEGTNDLVALSGDYALVVNPHIGYVSLLRLYTEPETIYA